MTGVRRAAPDRVLTAAWVIIAANVAATVVFARLHDPLRIQTAPWLLVVFTAAFAVVGAFPMRLEFGRHQVTVTLTDAVLVAAFPFMGPVWIGVAAAVGELVSCRLHRVAPLKTVFNAASRLGAGTIAAVAFAAAGGGHGWNWTDWQAALLAAAVYAVLNMVSVSTVVAIAERRRLEQIMATSLPMAVVTSLLAAPLGLIATELTARGVLSSLLLLPVAAGVALNNRSAAMHRDEHLRVERLHAATSRTAELQSLTDSLTTLAEEARGLLTGGAAMCCTQTPDGDWEGVLVNDSGSSRLDRPAIDALRNLASDVGAGYCRHEDLPLSIRQLVPDQALAAIAAVGTTTAPVVLAVHRRPVPGETRRGHLETLTAFATHASLTLTNARLYGEVETALATQIDLNRQKTEFVAAVSHELRTPLTSMLGAVETIVRLDGRMTDDKRSRFLQLTLQEGGRLKRLIEDLLLVAAAEHRAAAVEVAPIDVAEVLTTVVAELPPATQAEVTVATDAVQVEVWSDRRAVRQIVTNLVENAHKYAPGGTEIVARTTAGLLEVSVRDHGPGIPPEDRARVFERFVQLDQSATRRQGGTGLGLYLCRQLATQLGGRLALAETPGGGCTFTFTVPVDGMEAGSVRQEAMPAPVCS